MKTTIMTLTLVAVACGTGDTATETSATAGPSTTTSAPTTTSSVATTSTEATTTTAAPTITVGEPVVPPGPVAFQPLAGGSVLVESTQTYNNPGVVIRRDGLWHMFANDFRAWPGVVKVRHYTSGDGVAWAEATGTVFTSERSPFGTPQIAIGGYVSDEGVWSLYFHTFEGADRPAVIGRATAEAPEGPWTVHDEAVLEPGEADAWDELRVTRPSVVDLGDSVLMYYLGQDASGVGAIGVATSTDGVAWTKHPEPVLVAEGWEESLERPDVVKTDAGFVMIYRGTVGGPMGLAVSEDGFTWTRVADEPVFVAGREVEKNIYQGELSWSPENGLVFYLESGSGRRTHVYGWSFELP